VNFLLDTSFLLAALLEPNRLAHAARKIIHDEEQFSLSCVSFREIAHKSAAGKLDLNQSLRDFLAIAISSRIVPLTITPQVAADSVALPEFPNNDPYDQMIVATARCHGLTLLTIDRQLRHYRHASIRYFAPIGRSVL
jgi:PIN domain nuclease of toxin-antitoxin system